MSSLRDLIARTLIVLLFSGVIISCEDHTVFQKMERIEGDTWNLNDTVKVDFEVEDTLAPHDFYLKVRNNKEYPYQNIHLFLELEFPNGRKWLDTVEFKLADGKGNWTGSGIGDVKDHDFLFIKKRRFPVEGEHRFKVVHGMRREELRGIEDVGLGIKRTPRNER